MHISPFFVTPALIDSQIIFSAVDELKSSQHDIANKYRNNVRIEINVRFMSCVLALFTDCVLLNQAGEASISTNYYMARCMCILVPYLCTWSLYIPCFHDVLI